MTDGSSRLGRGLGALLAPRPVAAPDGQPRLVDAADYRVVPVDSLRPNPRQPRTALDDAALDELVASIRAVGLLQPVVVRAAEPNRYEIIMGERRWRAAERAGLQTLPVIVRQTPDDAMLRDALLENLHREQLNPLDEAAAYAQLLGDFGATHEQLAERVGRSRAHVTNTLRLLHLPGPVQRRVAAGVLSAGHARAILGVADAAGQERMATRVVAEGLSVRATEELVALGELEPVAASRRPQPHHPPPELAAVARALAEALDTRVKVQAGRTKGRIVVEFASLADLNRILAILSPVAQDALRAGMPDR